MILRILIASLFFSFSVFSQTYITNVTVLDVENKKLIQGQTIGITEAKISAIQKSSKVRIPEGATVIDGTKKYVIPGLVDAHVHFFQNGGLYARPDAIDLRKHRPYDHEIALTKSDMEDKLRRYLQNGVTTVFDVGATYNFLKKRKEFADKPIAPAIFMTGPLLTTYEPAEYENLGDNEPFKLTKTIEDGIKAVQEQLPYNPDFIKIWYIVGADGLSKEESARKNLPVVKAIIKEAHKHNLKVAVHATERITAQLAVENGANYLTHSIKDEILGNDFIELLKSTKTILCPTLTVHDGYGNTFGQKIQMSNHALLKSNPYQLGSLLDLKHLPDTLLINAYKKRSNSPKYKARGHKADSIRSVNLKKLSDAGVLIATGTDAGNIGTLHASSYLAELYAMKKSGMNNWQLLESSTINGAKILGKENEFGSIEVGKNANMILLNANPVAQLENITNIDLVINKGVVFKPEALVTDTPSDLVQRQLNAYNFRNIEAFLEPYDDNVEVFNFPNEFKYKGKEAMRKGYSKMFKKLPDLHCQLIERIVQGNIVIDKERVQFGSRTTEAVAIYHIENNKIKKVYFVH